MKVIYRQGSLTATAETIEDAAILINLQNRSTETTKAIFKKMGGITDGDTSALIPAPKRRKKNYLKKCDECEKAFRGLQGLYIHKHFRHGYQSKKSLKNGYVPRKPLLTAEPTASTEVADGTVLYKVV